MTINDSKNCYNEDSILYLVRNNLSYPNEIFNNLKESLINNVNITSIDNGYDFIVQIGKMTYTITTTKNQEKQINDNVTTIDLGKCETKLKDEYNISTNESLYILKIDVLIDNIQKLEYNVYYNFSFNNYSKLNLSVCKGIKIDISIPKIITENDIDKYNQNICIFKIQILVRIILDGWNI